MSKREPCPICQKPDWCGVTVDGAVCHCMRVESEHPCPSGGWFHFLAERPRCLRRWRTRAPARRMFDAEATMRGFAAEMDSPGGRGRDIFDSVAEFNADVGVSGFAALGVGVGRSAFHRAWAFPMRDGSGNVVGIRLRRYGSSDKWSVGGSHDGLFYDPKLEPREAPYNGVSCRELVIVEGATDTVAGCALGLPCVGRSSCGTGAEMLKALCARLSVGRVTIVSDNDEYKIRPDGTPWRPGPEGAKALARRLGRTYRIVTPPKKDLREWLCAGLNAETFWLVADLQPWRLPCAPTRGRGPELFPPSAPATPIIPHSSIRIKKGTII